MCVISNSFLQLWDGFLKLKGENISLKFKIKLINVYLAPGRVPGEAEEQCCGVSQDGDRVQYRQGHP